MDDYPPTTVTRPWPKPTGDPVTVRLLATGEDGRLYTGDLPSADDGLEAA